jgi:hypothetical protein
VITRYRRPRTATPFVLLSAIALVLACFVLWIGGLSWLGQGAEQNRASQTAEAQSAAPRPTFRLGPTPTPVPPCQWFEVSVEAAILRTCPDRTCARRERRAYKDILCIYGVAQDPRYTSANAWYVVDLNAQGAFRDLAYVFQDLVRPLNPTPRPSATFTPLPTITPLP